LIQKAPAITKKSSESLLLYLLQGIKLIFLSDNIGSASEGDTTDIEGMSQYIISSLGSITPLNDFQLSKLFTFIIETLCNSEVNTTRAT
jgi:superfamily II RNA helicase